MPYTLCRMPYALYPVSYALCLLPQALAFAATRPYHALTNNCIHFADLAVRVLTNGAVRGAPLLYDMACGAVPSFDNPMLLMMQMMLRLSWWVARAEPSGCGRYYTLATVSSVGIPGPPPDLRLNQHGICSFWIAADGDFTPMHYNWTAHS